STSTASASASGRSTAGRSLTAMERDRQVLSLERNFVLFKTDLFVFHQRDQDIDRWFVGGDCAGWFYARLLPVDRVRPFREPVMEDWGWTFGVSIDDVRVWINVWAFYEIENCWLFGIDAKKRLFSRKTSEHCCVRKMLRVTPWKT